jgi:hypothetical protein
MKAIPHGNEMKTGDEINQIFFKVTRHLYCFLGLTFLSISAI